MTMPDDGGPSNHPAPARPRRWGLYLPYVALASAIVLWSLFWLAARAQFQERLVRQAAGLRAAGYDAAWKRLSIGGYPFRLEVELTDPRVGEPSGWGVAAPRLKAMANAYDLGRWVIVAPEGLTLSRPAGAVAVSGAVLRASLADLGKRPRLAVEGQGLAFRPLRAGDLFALTAAERMELHLRAAEGDKAQLEVMMRGAQVRRAGPFARIAPLAPLSVTLSADLSKRSAFAGADWPQAVRRWTGEGGAITVGGFLLSIGDLGLNARGGPLTVGADGRLRGALGLNLRQHDAALLALGAAETVEPAAARAAADVIQARGGVAGADLQLTFEAGAATLGPVRLGPAPRIY